MDSRIRTEAQDEALAETEGEEEDLFSFICRLDAKSVSRLYASCGWSCKGVLQSLSGLARQLTLRLLSTEEPVAWELLERSVADDSTARQRLKEARREMCDLRVIVECGADSFALDPSFRGQILAALTSGDMDELPWQEAGLPQVDAVRMEDSARLRWTAVLHYIVGSSSGGAPEPEPRVVKLLVGMGLMQFHKGSYDRPHITRVGYHFMLRDIHEQLWLFIRHYTRQVDDSASVLQMLFKMSHCPAGTACSIASLDETQRRLLDDFELFGLVYRTRKAPGAFYPTSLGVNIVFGQSREEKMAAAARTVDMDKSQPVGSGGNKKVKADPSAPQSRVTKAQSSNKIFIIVETNFKLYCYTDSALHVEMVKLFAEPECILPNLLVAVITRNSIREAFRKGITADQIIYFVTENAHPLCEKRHRLVPDNITDQIILWEQERNRVVSRVGMLYDQFQPGEEALFEACRRHAEKQGWLLFAGTEPRALVIHDSRREEMRQFIKATKAAQ